MGDIVIKYESEHRGSAKQVASGLKTRGYSVDLEQKPDAHVHSAVPAPYYIETVAIFIGSGVATTLVNDVVTDVYEAAKEWARQRVKRKVRNSMRSHPSIEQRTIQIQKATGEINAREASRAMREAKKQLPPMRRQCSFTIYGPDGEELLSWRINDTGEYEQDNRDGKQPQAQVPASAGRDHLRLTTAIAFDRFTEQAKGIIMAAEDEARSLCHGYVGTEHLLIAMIRDSENPAAKILIALGVTLEKAVRALEDIIGRGEQGRTPEGNLPFTPRLKHVLALAVEESLRKNHGNAGPAQILAVTVGEGEGIAVKILTMIGGDDAIARIIHMLETPTSSHSAKGGELNPRRELLKSLLISYPAMGSIFGERHAISPLNASEALGAHPVEMWRLLRSGRYAELAEILGDLIPNLEAVSSNADTADTKRRAKALLSDAYQLTAAVLAALGDAETACLAADRSANNAVDSGDPLLVAAAMFRKAKVFLDLERIPEARQVATETAEALESSIVYDADDPGVTVLSMAGALQSLLAMAAAKGNARSEAAEYLGSAVEIAERIGEDCHDNAVEFGPTYVIMDAVSVAVALGDAGEALDLARDIVSHNLPPQRTCLYFIDLASAHAMRRQFDEALHRLLDAERLAPDHTHAHRVARDITRDLVRLSAPILPPELRELASRIGLQA